MKALAEAGAGMEGLRSRYYVDCGRVVIGGGKVKVYGGDRGLRGSRGRRVSLTVEMCVYSLLCC